MKKFIVRFWIILLTFTIGISATLLWIKYKPAKESLEEVNISETSAEEYNVSEVLNIEYCEIINNPQKYEGKFVRLKDAKLYWFQHGYFLKDDKCSGKDNSVVTAIVFDESKRELVWNALESLHPTTKLFEPTEVDTVGKFMIAKRDCYYQICETSSSIQDRTDLHFEIWKLESTKR